jgi:hypothetical protein
MSERGSPRRDAITRARFFLEQARRCRYSDDMAWQEPFEAYMEASLIFGRTAVHRLKASAERRAKGNPSLKAEVRAWWASLADEPAIQFFRRERDFIVHEGPPKVGHDHRNGWALVPEGGGTLPLRREPQHTRNRYYRGPPERGREDRDRCRGTVRYIVSERLVVEGLGVIRSPYSPECLEGLFSELRVDGVPRI